MLNLPISYICLRNGFIPETVIIVAIILSQICFIARIYMLKSIVKTKDYLKHVYINILLTLIIASIIPIVIKLSFNNYTLLNFILNILLTLITSSISILFIGCNKQERNFIYSYISNIKNKLSKI